MRLSALLAASLVALAGLLPSAASATYTSGAPITACNQYGGGVKLFSLEDQAGEDRVWCPDPDGVDVDDDFGDVAGFGNSVLDVGLFNNMTDSIRLRAPVGCSVQLYLYTGLDQGGTELFYQANNFQGTTAKTKDIDVPDNVVSSGFISTVCG